MGNGFPVHLHKKGGQCGVFANGVRYHNDKGVRQWDGTYKQGITYEGYYIVATDRRIPFCTVLEVTNHRWEGAGIENNVPLIRL